MTNWEDALRALPTPQPPATTVDRVMARVRSMETAGQTSETDVRPREQGHGWTDRRILVFAVGIATVLAAYLAELDAASLADTIIMPRLLAWMGGTAVTFGATAGSVMAVTGLTLYLGVALLVFRAEFPATPQR